MSASGPPLSRRQERLVDAFVAQATALADWFAVRTPQQLLRATGPSGRSVGDLGAHLIITLAELSDAMERPSRARPLTWSTYLDRAATGSEASPERARAFTTNSPPLSVRLADAVDAATAVLRQAWPKVVETGCGPVRSEDFVAGGIVALLVGADDLSSLPELPDPDRPRAAVAVAVRTLAAVLGERHPGSTVEVRIPPWAAVQCGTGAGSTHTRGTPPNVVELQPDAFLRLATGRLDWAQARAEHQLTASGAHSDLSALLPLLQVNRPRPERS